jgi:hypothetical protein
MLVMQNIYWYGVRIMLEECWGDVSACRDLVLAGVGLEGALVCDAVEEGAKKATVPNHGNYGVRG